MCIDPKDLFVVKDLKDLLIEMIHKMKIIPIFNPFNQRNERMSSFMIIQDDDIF
jgi:hypothetical protein